MTVERFTGKLGEWLPAETAGKIAGQPAGEAKLTYNPSTKFPHTDVIAYAWKSGRTKQSGSLKIAIPVQDTVKAGFIRHSTLQQIQDKLEMTKGEAVADLGESAVWNAKDQQLIVLAGSVEFSVWVDVSQDAAVNKAKSIELAKTLVGRL